MRPLLRAAVVILVAVVAVGAAAEVKMEWVAERRAHIDGLPTGGYVDHGRRLYVHVPEGYASGDARHRVLYIFDGESALSGGDGKPGRLTLDMDRVLDELVAEGTTHPAILVAIPNSDPSQRVKELSPPTQDLQDKGLGRLDQTHLYIAEVLKPYIDAHFRTRPEAEFTGIAGCSWGGFAACWLGYHHPEIYGMAAVTSLGIYADGYVMQTEMCTDEGGFTGTRFWFDTGSREGVHRGGDLQKVVRALVARGWREEMDVAFHLNHGGGHGYKAWPPVMRPMLTFLLRKKYDAPTALRLVGWYDREITELNPGRDGDHARAIAELEYSGGYRTHPATAALASVYPRLMTLNPDHPGLPLCHAPGRVDMLAGWKNLMAKIPVRTFSPDAVRERIPLPRTPSEITIDGLRSDWPDVTVPTDPAAPYRIGAYFDEDYLYILVDVEDEKVINKPGIAPWKQDGIELRLDARPPELRDLGRGDEEGRDIMLVALCPGESGRPPATIIPKRDFPRGVIVESERRQRGYVNEIAVPVSWLNAQRGGPWDGVRMNLIVNDFDVSGKLRTKYEWRPDWRSDANRVGSGVLVKTGE